MRIEDRLRYPGTVNLYGLHGVGKTVLGWAMAASGRVVYVTHPARLKESSLSIASVLFLDNIESERTTFRRLSGILEDHRVEKAIVVTHAPVDDYVFRIELQLADEDILTVQRNLEYLGYPIYESGWNNLWRGLMQTARDEK